ncbi:transposase [Nonomuraea salmonea]|uniref:Transposase n=1 Tax=Nonomuraea salmonea TaxID=46181 RepID=A0ABV5P6B8_9ACTN
MATLVRTIFDQPTAEQVRTQHAWVIDALEAKYPAACEHLDAAREDLLAFAAFPRETWRQIWSNCEDLLVPPGRGPGPWSNWPCCLGVDLPVLAPGGACWRRTGRRVPIGALPLQGTITVLTVTPARRRPSPHRSFKEPDDHRQHARARLQPPDRRHCSGRRYA